MVFLFREKGILKQTYEFLKKCGIDNLGICFGEGFIQGDIMLSTVQSVEKILDTHLNEAEVLLVDEVHQFCKGDLTTAAINSFPNAQFRFGFTATPPTEHISAYNLESAFGETYTTRSTQDLIADGKLAKATIQIIPFKPKLTDIDNDLSYQEIYEKFIVNSEERNKIVVDLVEAIKKQVPDSKILILVKNLDHLNILKKLIKDAFTLEGADDLSERYKVVSKFIKAKNAAVLVGTTVLQTGIDIKAITHMINARSLQGEIPTIQGMGRALRTSGNKEAFIYDFMDHVPYLDGHSKQRIKHYEAEGHKVEKL
jgi:superfamily II DNA or RNA helicase